MPNLNEKIVVMEKQLLALKDQMSRIEKSIQDGEDLTDEQLDTSVMLTAEFDDLFASLVKHRKLEESMKKSISAPAIIQAKNRIAKESDPLDLFFKNITVKVLSHVQNKSAEQIQQEQYPNHGQLEAITKSTVLPADTQQTGWAAELVQTGYGAFMDALKPVSFFTRLASRGLQVTFGKNGKIVLPASDPRSTTDLAGSFLKEGGYIPVKKTRFKSVTLTPSKAAVICDFTREIFENSTPAIEALLRSQIISDTANALDIKAISADAALALEAPAGLMNGVTAVASSGTTTTSIITDIRGLVNPLLAANHNMANVVLLTHEQHLLGLSLATTAAGNFIFPSVGANGTLLGYPIIASNNVPVGTVVAIAADSLVSAIGTPMFSVSDQATIIQADDDGVEPDIGTHTDVVGHVKDATNARTVHSLFQADMIALRMILDVSWALRRSGAVTALKTVSW